MARSRSSTTKNTPAHLASVVKASQAIAGGIELEVLQRHKPDPRTRLIPIVVLTSSQEERNIVEIYQLGVNSYIVKE